MTHEEAHALVDAIYDRTHPNISPPRYRFADLLVREAEKAEAAAKKFLSALIIALQLEDERARIWKYHAALNGLIALHWDGKFLENKQEEVRTALETLRIGEALGLPVDDRFMVEKE